MSMEIELPGRVSLTVNVGAAGRGVFRHFLDVFVTMEKPVGGTDGYCGDLDGDRSDETKQRFQKRVDELRVSPEETLFDRELSHKVLLLDESSEADISDTSDDEGRTRQDPSDEEEEELECLSGTQQEAASLCSLQLPSTTSPDLLDACSIDSCVGGEEMIGYTAMFAAQAEAIVEEELVSAEASVQEPVVVCHTCIEGDGCFDDVKWAIGEIPTGYYDERGWSPAVSTSSCFEEVQAALHIWQSLPDFVVGGMQEKAVPVPCDATTPERRMMHGLEYCR